MLISTMQEYEWNEMRNCQRPLLRLLELNDSLKVDRNKMAVDKLSIAFKQNEGFYKYNDSLLCYIIKLIYRNEEFGAQVRQQKNLLTLIERWTKENKKPPTMQTRSKQTFKKKAFRWQQYFNKDIDYIEHAGKDQFTKLSNWYKGKYEMESKEYDSDDEMYEYTFKEGDEVDFLHTSKDSTMRPAWYSGKVQKSMGEMVKVTNTAGPSPTSWIEVESDKLAPHGLMAHKIRVYVDMMFDYAYKRAEQESLASNMRTSYYA